VARSCGETNKHRPATAAVHQRELDCQVEGAADCVGRSPHVQPAAALPGERGLRPTPSFHHLSPTDWR